MKLIVLDRDGVINEDSAEYIKSPEEYVPIGGSLGAIARLKKAGYTVVVASNQSGIARGYFTLETLKSMHQKLQDLLKKIDAKIDDIFFCPHGPDDGCDCRKPRTGLFKQILAKYPAPAADVCVIGDSIGDIKMAVSVGARPILVLTGKGEKTKETVKCDAQLSEQLAGMPVYADLSVAVDAILKQTDKK